MYVTFLHSLHFLHTHYLQLRHFFFLSFGLWKEFNYERYFSSVFSLICMINHSLTFPFAECNDGGSHYPKLELPVTDYIPLSGQVKHLAGYWGSLETFDYLKFAFVLPFFNSFELHWLVRTLLVQNHHAKMLVTIQANQLPMETVLVLTVIRQGYHVILLSPLCHCLLRGKYLQNLR